MQEMQEMWVRSLGWEDALQEGMATLLQCSYLENAMDRGTWQAIVHRVTKKSEMTEQLTLSLFFTLLCRVK